MGKALILEQNGHAHDMPYKINSTKHKNLMTKIVKIHLHVILNSVVLAIHMTNASVCWEMERMLV